MRWIIATIVLLAGAGLLYVWQTSSDEQQARPGAEPVSADATAASEDAADSATEALTETERLYAFFEVTYEAQIMRSPITLSFLGRKDRYDEWGDFSDARTDREIRIAHEELDRLHDEFDFDALSPDAQVSYLTYEHGHRSSIEADEFRFQFYPGNQMNNAASFITLILTQIHPTGSVEDVEAYLSRLNALEVALGQFAEIVRSRAEFGTLLPEFSYPMMLEQLADVMSGVPFDDGEEDSLYLADIRTKIEALEIEQAEKDRLIAEVIEALDGPVRRGFASLAAAYEAAAQMASGINGVWNLPDGPRFYEQRIRNYTHSNMTAQELHAFGLGEVDRLQTMMRDIMAEVGFDGTLQEFFHHLEEDPSNFYSNDDEGRAQFMADSEAQIAAVLEIAPQYFNRLPVAELTLERVQPFREDAAALASYNSPAPDGSRPGIYWINLRDLQQWPKHSMATTTYHEAVPGHHFHLALQQELENVPSFQRFGGTTVYSEGLALYAERLAGEMGMHVTPYQEFGRIVGEIARDVRLVVDTGIHSMQWTREQAFDYMLANSGWPEGEVRSEIDRYFVLPGQALAYRIGQERFLQLREHARESLGEAFDIRDYHDVVLSNGAVPMSVLEIMVQRYIDEKLAD